MHKLLKSDRFREIVFFGIAGTVGFFIDVAVTVLFEPLIGDYLARIPGLVAAATSTWLINRSLTFKTRKSRHTSVWKEYLHYLSLMFAGAVISYGVYAVIVTLVSYSPFRILIAIALGSLAGMVVNYLSSRRFVYNKENN
jgi:putative flippase GtrA